MELQCLCKRKQSKRGGTKNGATNQRWFPWEKNHPRYFSAPRRRPLLPAGPSGLGGKWRRRGAPWPSSRGKAGSRACAPAWLQGTVLKRCSAGAAFCTCKQPGWSSVWKADGEAGGGRSCHVCEQPRCKLENVPRPSWDGSTVSTRPKACPPQHRNLPLGHQTQTSPWLVFPGSNPV